MPKAKQHSSKWKSEGLTPSVRKEFMRNYASTTKSTIGQKAGSIALAAALALGTMGASFAAPATALAENGIVTITSTQENTTGTVKYKAYCLFTAEIDSSDNASNVAWAVDDSIQSTIIEFLNNGGNGASQTYDAWLVAQGKAADADSVTDTMQNNARNACEYISAMINASLGVKSPTWVDDDTFADQLAETVMNNVTSYGVATSGAAYTADEGYYLFVTDADTLGTAYVASSPIWLALGGSTTTVSEKAEAPQIEKTVQEDSTDAYGDYADAEIGQTVNYKIVVDIPSNYNTFSSFYFEVGDKMDSGLTMSSTDIGNVKVYVGDTSGTDATSNFTISFNSSSNTLTVKNDNTKDASTGCPSITAGCKVTITYSAYLTGESVVYGSTGNNNTATYTYSNNPYDTSTYGKDEDTAKLYTYILTVDKLDESTPQALEGAKFVIKNESGYYLTDSGWTTQTQADAKVFTTDSNGAISNIKGLDAGDTYTLIEIEAPTGYSLASDTSIKITPTYDEEGTLTALAVNATGSNVSYSSATYGTGTVNVDVNNVKNVGLAMTGGVGVGVVGIVVVAVGLGWYLKRRRDNGKDAPVEG